MMIRPNHYRAVLALPALLMAAPCAPTGAISAPPVLRIETGAHTAPIRSIAADASGRWVATASEDKSVRIWETETGHLNRTLRVPIAGGEVGQMRAVAISPDASLVACAGITAVDGSPSGIYLFDRAGGMLQRRIAVQADQINQLAISPDGKRLAAATGNAGVCVFSLPDGKPLWQDAKYEGRSYGCAFDRAGKLVTGCWDGFVRLYDESGALRFKRRPLDGRQPYRVAFNADGDKIAVGFEEDFHVVVLSSANLETLYRPETTDIVGESQSLVCVAFSRDGRTLYAGGTFGQGSNVAVRSWSNAGRGVHIDIPVCRSTLFDLAPLPTGALLFASADPTWGVLGAAGKVVRRMQDTVADFRDDGTQLRVSNDGLTVRYSYESFGSRPAQFSIARRVLDVAPGGDATRLPKIPKLIVSRTDAPGLNVTDWKGKLVPKLNGARLDIPADEFARSVAVAPDNERFLLGAERMVRCFDRSGKLVWHAAAPGVAWAVNVSGDGRLGIAAFADGSIRWYNMKTGAELLTLFPHADARRWVAWTPSGYYDASAAGEDLIGWHLDRGTEHAPEFYPASRFRDPFYRPDIVARVLETADEPRAVALANQESRRNPAILPAVDKAPPVVRIVSPDGTYDARDRRLALRVGVRSSAAAPVTDLRVRINGRPIDGEKRIDVIETRDNGEVLKTLPVALPEADCTLSVIAENQFGKSDAATLIVHWKGAMEPSILKPVLYIVAVGVSDNQDKAYRLSYAARDATAFAELMKRQRGKLYRDVVVRVLIDKDATRDSIVDKMDWLRKQATSRDVAMLMLSGHGFQDQQSNYYFVPYNFDRNHQLQTTIGFADIKSTVKGIAGKVAFFVDTCHAGYAIGSKGNPADITRIVNELQSAESGAVVFSSSTGSETSIEDPTFQHGIFTFALLEGLKGKADMYHTGRVTAKMLDLYISERVKQLTDGSQHPTTSIPPSVPDFPLTIP